MAGKSTDIKPVDVSLYFIPIETRIPLKFGPQTLTHVTMARVCMRVADANGKTAEGWGETPLSVQWVWPTDLTYDERHEALRAFSVQLAGAWAEYAKTGHPIEVGYSFIFDELPKQLETFNSTERAGKEAMPWLAALVCCSAFDLAMHDAYGVLHGVNTYETYTAEYMNQDLSAFLTPAEDADVDFAGKYPADYLVLPRPDKLPAWHLSLIHI